MKYLSLSLALAILFACPLLSQPTNGLICWFPFNGNADDESLNGHNAAVAGPSLTEDRHGNPNNAYLFDGIDDFMLVPDQADIRLGNTSFTISLWIRPDIFSQPWTHSILSKRAGAGNQGYMFQFIGPQHPFFLPPATFNMVLSGSDDPILNSDIQISLQEWHHVLYCFDKETGTAQFFTDNVPDAQGPMIEANGTVTENLYIGKDNLTGGFYFTGALDDIRIYNRKLTRRERDELFREGIVAAEEKTSKNIAITIYPDPVSDILNITTESTDIKYIDIHDAAGRLVYHTLFATEIDCKSMAPGSYYISFFDKNQRLIRSEKFIKL